MKTLTKEIGRLSASVTGGLGAIEDDTAGGWKLIPASRRFYFQTYFDLAGMSKEEKTLFFSGAATQNANPPTSNPAAPGNRVQIIDIMTTKPLTETELGFIYVYANMEQTVLTFDQTVYMRNRTCNTDLDNQAAAVMITIFDEQLGSLEPTASDRIYCTRLVSIDGADGFYNLYPVRYLLRAEAKEEDEYQYLMRLKRSYELQQSFDRD